LLNAEQEDTIYRKLQQHLDEMPIGFPEAESGSDIDLLRILFTPIEAKIATFLKSGWYLDIELLDKIYEITKSYGISSRCCCSFL
jgi:hypothetical protein